MDALCCSTDSCGANVELSLAHRVHHQEPFLAHHRSGDPSAAFVVGGTAKLHLGTFACFR